MNALSAPDLLKDLLLGDHDLLTGLQEAVMPIYRWFAFLVVVQCLVSKLKPWGVASDCIHSRTMTLAVGTVDR